MSKSLKSFIKKHNKNIGLVQSHRAPIKRGVVKPRIPADKPDRPTEDGPKFGIKTKKKGVGKSKLIEKPFKKTMVKRKGVGSAPMKLTDRPFKTKKKVRAHD